jgi:hypothetical protein
MLISRNYEAKDWEALTFTSEADWEKAVAIFQDRIETRYLEHIERILKHRTSGFAALTLHCALIETLEQFRHGTKRTPSRQGKKYFVSFLTGTSFKEHVSADQARLFYTNIRCGLLHQAEAESSVVKRNSKHPLISFTEDHKGVIVNAKAFHAQLEKAIHEYSDLLRKPESTKERDAFRKKMNYICQVENEPPEERHPPGAIRLRTN